MFTITSWSLAGLAAVGALAVEPPPHAVWQSAEWSRWMAVLAAESLSEVRLEIPQTQTSQANRRVGQNQASRSTPFETVIVRDSATIQRLCAALRLGWPVPQNDGEGSNAQEISGTLRLILVRDPRAVELDRLGHQLQAAVERADDDHAVGNRPPLPAVLPEVVCLTLRLHGATVRWTVPHPSWHGWCFVDRGTVSVAEVGSSAVADWQAQSARVAQGWAYGQIRSGLVAGVALARLGRFSEARRTLVAARQLAGDHPGLGPDLEPSIARELANLPETDNLAGDGGPLPFPKNHPTRD